MRILAAEDNPLTRLDLRAILQDAGHEVCAEARDGLEAVELAREVEPDLAIVDVLLPGLDGIEATRRIVDERAIPVVVLTGSADAGVAERAAAAGAGAYVTKPYSDHDVLAAVEEAARRRPAPGHEATRSLYRAHAPVYDWESLLFMRYRRRAVELLELEPGDAVLDAGCGTGLCFPLLQDRIGPAGRLVGFDVSPEMLAKADERVGRAGWRNVTLAAGPAEQVEVDCEPVDAVLFSFTHDVLQSPEALANVFRHARDGARVAAVGPCWAPAWAAWLNGLLAWQLRAYVTRLDGLDRPWRLLAEHVADLEVDAGAGVIYTASGRFSRRRT
jgi:demethylmenaquinone methyltransferase/2-methoxy-6-polyprenyl-1,4-benzoquinol methylase